MAKLLASLLGSRTESRFTIDDYVQMVNETLLSGLLPPFSQTMPADRESIEANFVGLVHAAYKDNGIVFACMLTRRSLFTEARFQFRARTDGRPGPLFGTPALTPLERPFPGGVTADLLARIIDDADLAGNWFGWLNEGEIIRLRPDWVDIALAPRIFRGGIVGYRKVGYIYYEDGNRGRDGVPFSLDEVSHFAPNPDPIASWRGMSWLTPIVREILADKQATKHKLKFWENGATPNMVIRLPELSPEKFKKFKEIADAEHKGADNAYKTLYVGGGADVTVVGKDFKQLDFKQVQGAGETRIAAAANVHPVIVGLSEGLAGSSLNEGNFNAARRLTGDKFLRPAWRNAVASLEQIVQVPIGAELWYDEREVAFLRSDQKDIAEIQSLQSTAIRQFLDAGFDPDAAVRFIQADDLSALIGAHSGLFSVQLRPPGEDSSSGDVPVTGRDNVIELVSAGWTVVPPRKAIAA